MVILLALISICIAVSAFAQTGKSQKQMTEDDLEYSTELNNLGMRFLNGNDVDQDYAEAVKWFRKAAGYGNSAAQYNLAYCYEKGLGVTKDTQEGIRLLRSAAKRRE